VAQRLAEACYPANRDATKSAESSAWLLSQLRKRRDYLKLLAAAMGTDVSAALTSLDITIAEARLRVLM
jgi:hypothetical protein